ncbi:endomucin isoform X1 [Rousettus aegyptiacus]|uniref:Endomucin n=1 Tax=Rousettus aegyptiacus TaxID=9407 RepID=A0A7J8E7D3_ROUAE|nr:endomucin isoform X1 [Rousettus aegyptiacus]KAF6431109.1 endomucin [Rousettus aegyptiacus]
MKLLQVTILCLLSSLCSSKDIQNGTTPLPTSSMISAPAPTTSVITPRTTSSPNPTKAITGVSPEETTNKSLQTSLLPTLSSLTTTVKGNTTNGVTKNKFITANATETNLLLPNVVSTLQSSQHMTENQNSTKTTGKPVTSVNVRQPDASPSNTSLLPSISKIPENTSQSQGTENAKNASSSSSSPSYSSVILPVVIALIVITLSAFVLVGLYRMCRKTDPGTPENGNDQPQSDKESVKLLTVKTISHEYGEHSAQGKNKN